MQDVQSRLLRIEDKFISALADYSFDDFACYESKLHDDIHRAIPADQANDSVLEFANIIFNRSRVVAHQFFLLNQKYQALTDLLHKEVEEILDKNPQSSPKTKFNPQASTEPSPLPPYIASAYKWLLDNLHCPYPTISVKDSFAKQSGSSRKTIDAWFTDVRKRIGWSSLRKSHYSGKKRDIIRAATEFFQENKHVDTALHFAAIQGAAKELYAGKLCHSALASQIGMLIDQHKPSTPRSTSIHSSERASTPLSAPRTPSPPTTLCTVPCKETIRFKRTRLHEEETDAIGFSSRPSKRQRQDSNTVSVSPSYNTVSPTRSPLSKTADSPTETGSSVSKTADSPTETGSSVSKTADSLKESCASTEMIPLTHALKDASIAHRAISTCDFLSGTSVATTIQHQVTDRPTPPGRRRCITGFEFRFPSAIEHKTPRLQSVSDSLVTPPPGNLSEWNLGPDLPYLNSSSDDIDYLSTCNIEAFDFSVYNAQDDARTHNKNIDPPSFPIMTSSESLPNILNTPGDLELLNLPDLLELPLGDPLILSCYSMLQDPPISAPPLDLGQQLETDADQNSLFEANQPCSLYSDSFDTLLHSFFPSPTNIALELWPGTSQDEEAKGSQQLAEFKLTQE